MTRRRGDGVRGGLVGAIRLRPAVAVAAAAGGVELGLDEVARKSNHKERLKCERIVFQIQITYLPCLHLEPVGDQNQGKSTSTTDMQSAANSKCGNDSPSSGENFCFRIESEVRLT